MANIIQRDWYLVPENDEGLSEISSPNGQFRLALHNDGNLVLKDAGGNPLWSSGTDGQAVKMAVMQGDGNFVIYLHNNQPVWASNTNGQPGAFLEIRDDGTIAVVNPTPAIWSAP